MKALVLAAGMGNRLESITSDKPKALVPVDGKPLIDHILGRLEQCDFEEIGVVGGCHFEQLQEHLSGRGIRLFNNKRYTEANIFSVETALDFFDTDVLMTNVDHIYTAELFTHLLSKVKGLTAMCDFDRKLAHDDMKVKVNDDGKLMKISKQLTEYEAGYIGMTYCSKEMNNIYKQGVKETINIYGNDSSVEFILGHLAANDVSINIFDTSGYRWFEIDTPEELRFAETALAKGRES